MKKELLQVANGTHKCLYKAYERKNGTQLSKKSDETNAYVIKIRIMEEREEGCYHLPDTKIRIMDMNSMTQSKT